MREEEIGLWKKEMSISISPKFLLLNQARFHGFVWCYTVTYFGVCLVFNISDNF